MWLSIAKFSTPELDLPVADEHDAPEFGGRRSLAWAVARQVGAIRLAEEGRRDDALGLLHPVPGATAGNFEDDPFYVLAVEAIAGEPDRVATDGRSLIVPADRRSDVVWHAELVLILGIALTAPGATPTASFTSRWPNVRPCTCPCGMPWLVVSVAAPGPSSIPSKQTPRSIEPSA